MIGYPAFHGWDGPLGSGASPQIPRRPGRHRRARTPRRRRRILRRIEQDVVTSDPSLARLFSFFTRLAEGEEMPRIEKIGGWRARLGGRVVRLARRVVRRRPAVKERV